MIVDSETMADLAAALAELTDTERDVLEHRAFSVACHFADVTMPRVAAVFHALAVLVAEEGDRRAGLAEHARGEVEGDNAGALVTDIAGMLAAARAELLAAARAEAAEHGEDV